MAQHTITLIPGDGVGPEVSEAARRVIDATGVAIDWEVHDAGLGVMDQYGDPLPAFPSYPAYNQHSPYPQVQPAPTRTYSCRPPGPIRTLETGRRRPPCSRRGVSAASMGTPEGTCRAVPRRCLPRERAPAPVPLRCR